MKDWVVSLGGAVATIIAGVSMVQACHADLQFKHKTQLLRVCNEIGETQCKKILDKFKF